MKAVTRRNPVLETYRRSDTLLIANRGVKFDDLYAQTGTHFPLISNRLRLTNFYGCKLQVQDKPKCMSLAKTELFTINMKD